MDSIPKALHKTRIYNRSRSNPWRGKIRQMGYVCSLEFVIVFFFVCFFFRCCRFLFIRFDALSTLCVYWGASIRNMSMSTLTANNLLNIYRHTQMVSWMLNVNSVFISLFIGLFVLLKAIKYSKRLWFESSKWQRQEKQHTHTSTQQKKFSHLFYRSHCLYIEE